MIGECTCRYCGQSWLLHSNRAVRAIARYYLSLSLPFADCSNESCANHGKNVFEHWSNRRSASRAYRRLKKHLVLCRACEKSVNLGGPRAVRTKMRNKAMRKTPPLKPMPVVRARWEHIINGLLTQNTATDAYEVHGIPTGTYYDTLPRIGARLRDYHSFRNARLLHPGGPHRDQPWCASILTCWRYHCRGIAQASATRCLT